MWDALVEVVRATIFAGAHLFGGSLGTSIVVISTLVRLAVLPLVLRSARQARVQQVKLAELRPFLERLKQKYKADPQRFIAETQALYRRHGIRFMSGTSLVSLIIQLPLLGALFSAVRSGLGVRVRFLWVSDLSRVDGLVAVLVTGLAAGAALMTPATPEMPITPRAMAFVIAMTTLVFLLSASSAVALSVGAGSIVSAFQNWLLQRDAMREARLA